MSRAPSRPSPFAVFRNRSFRLVWTGQLISTAGDALTALAAGILVYRLTGTALSVGLMLVATSLPSLVLGLFGGVIADRHDRRRVMVACCSLQALFVGLIPLLLPRGVAWLYVLVALSSCAAQFYGPAFESVLPELASDDELAAANAFMSISTVGSTALGYAAAGLLAARLELSWVFALDALTFAAAALCLSRIAVARPAADEAPIRGTVLGDLRAGLGYLFGHRTLRAVLAVGLGFGLASGVLNTLTLPFTVGVLGASEAVFGVQEALTAVGFVAGSLLIATFADRLPERAWVASSLSALGLAALLYALAGTVPVAVLAFTLIGLFNSPATVAIRLVFQRQTPAALRGRVIGAYFVGVEGALVLGLAVGGLADVFSVRALLAVGALIVLFSGLAAAFLPGLKADAAAAGDEGGSAGLVGSAVPTVLPGVAPAPETPTRSGPTENGSARRRPGPRR